jgi:hypothetical protein
MNRAVPKYMTSFTAMERFHSSLRCFPYFVFRLFSPYVSFSDSLVACIPSARTITGASNSSKRDAASSKSMKDSPAGRVVGKDVKDSARDTPPPPVSSTKDSKESTPAPGSLRVSFKTPAPVGGKSSSATDTPQATASSVKAEKTPSSAKVAVTPAKQLPAEQLPMSSPLAAANVDASGLKGWQRQTASATVEMMQQPSAADLVDFGPGLAAFLEKHPDLWCFTEIRNRVLLGKISVPGLWESSMWKVISDYHAFFDDGTPQRANAVQMRSSFQKKLEAIHEENTAKKNGGWRPNIARFQALETSSSSDVPDCLESLRKVNGTSIPLAAHLDFCQKLLLIKLMKHRNAWPFLEPVDPIEHNVPDYLDVVKVPMDFGTIAQRLKNNKYSNMTAFISAICLVFDNAILYNGDDSTFGKHAVKLREVVSRDIFDWCSLLPKKISGSDVAEPATPVAMEVGDDSFVVPEEEDDAPAKGSKHGAAVSRFLQLDLIGASANHGIHAAFPTEVPHVYLQVDNNDETCGICGGDGNAALCFGCFPRVPIGRITQPSR